MIKTEQRDIRGLSVTSVQLPAMRSYGVFTRLGVVLGPALAALTEGGADLSNLEADLTGLGPAIGALLGGLAEDVPLVLALLQSTYVVVDGSKIELTSEAKIDQAFSGNFLAMLMTLKFAIEVNFADFLDAGRTALSAQQKAAADQA